MKPIFVISHQSCLDHDVGSQDHPETSSRVEAIFSRLRSDECNLTFSETPSRPAEREWILTAHDENYLFFFEEAALSGRSFLQQPDNRMCFESYEAALCAAGAGLVGVDLIEIGGADIGVSGENWKAFGQKTVFCCVRPPGHHAERSRASGFCFLNNAVIAANYWRQKYGRKRVFIIDWDAHHGNGIQAAFEDDPDVFYASVHEHPTFSFPGSGFADERGRGYAEGSILNVPLPPGARDEMMFSALQGKIEPALAAFKPDALLVAAGFDGHRSDDMSGLAFSTELFGEIGKLMAKWGMQYCEERILTILEGGYDPESLGKSVEAYLTGFSSVCRGSDE